MTHKEQTQEKILDPTTDLKALCLALAKTLDQLEAMSNNKTTTSFISLFYEDLVNPPIKFRS
jgi:hypothetical protein